MPTEEVAPNPPTRSLSRRRITATAAVQLVGRTLGLVLGLGVAAGLARGLGPDRFGQFALAMTLAAIGGSVADFGVAQVATREMAAQPEARARLTGGLFLVRLSLGLAVG